MGKEEFLERLRDIKIQGAKEIAIESLKFLKDYAKKNGFGKGFEKLAKIIEEVRPTAVVIHNCLEIVRKEKKIETIDKLLRNLREFTNKIAKNGSPLIKNGYVIMTHCHSGEALSVIKRAWKDGKKISVIATETSPKFQGVKTAKELAAAGIPVTLITDAAIGFFMGKIDMVIVGCDAFRANGVVNKVGTYPMALVAKYYKKPLYVIASTFKIDKRKKIIIEQRPSSEIYHSIKGVRIMNPVFDITPLNLVYRVVCEKGVMTTGNFLKLIKSK